MSRARRWAGLVVSAVALAAVVRWASRQEAPQFPSGPGAVADLAAAVGLYALATLARGWRWHRLLQGLGARHRTADAYALVTVGYFGNTVLPARGGELLRTVLLAGRSQARKTEVLGSILSERLLDAVSLALLFAALTLSGAAANPMGPRPALLALAALVLGAVAFAGYLRARRAGRLTGFADRIRPLVIASRPLIGRAGLQLGALSLLIWSLESAIFWLAAHALGVAVTLPEAGFLVVLSALFAIVPAAPGYVGTFDAAVLFGLKAVGVTGGQALGFVVLVRFVLFVPVTLVGFVLLVTRYRGQWRERPAIRRVPAAE